MFSCLSQTPFEPAQPPPPTSAGSTYSTTRRADTGLQPDQYQELQRRASASKAESSCGKLRPPAPSDTSSMFGNFYKRALMKAERVVGWARNHHLSSVILPSFKGDRLVIPRESLDIVIARLREQESTSKKTSQNLKNLAKDEFESNFISAVVPPEEVGVRFDDIGALEEVKTTLDELVTLPMRRPELFTHGNLLRPCKGILLFGPPGAVKTLLAKALATESGANFISITGSTVTSKWFGDAEKLTRALFSFASRLAPAIIFVDEVDSLLGARGGPFEHEATRRLRNEFMAAWDGLRTKENQRILVLAATNRPFDLDDAVIRRLPRRIFVDLPNTENRTKILKIILSKENLEQGFRYEELANATEGYSGSDLKNLCVTAAYKPVQELLQEEKEGGATSPKPSLRPLKLDVSKQKPRSAHRSPTTLLVCLNSENGTNNSARAATGEDRHLDLAILHNGIFRSIEMISGLKILMRSDTVSRGLGIT